MGGTCFSKICNGFSSGTEERDCGNINGCMEGRTVSKIRDNKWSSISLLANMIILGAVIAFIISKKGILTNLEKKIVTGSLLSSGVLAIATACLQPNKQTSLSPLYVDDLDEEEEPKNCLSTIKEGLSNLCNSKKARTEETEEMPFENTKENSTPLQLRQDKGDRKSTYDVPEESGSESDRIETDV